MVSPMPKTDVRVATNRPVPVLRITVDQHYVFIPLDQARSTIDAAHDALDAYELEARQKENTA